VLMPFRSDWINAGRTRVPNLVGNGQRGCLHVTVSDLTERSRTVPAVIGLLAPFARSTLIVVRGFEDCISAVSAGQMELVERYCTSMVDG
jgi:hypothetical protein